MACAILNAFLCITDTEEVNLNHQAFIFIYTTRALKSLLVGVGFFHITIICHSSAMSVIL